MRWLFMTTEDEKNPDESGIGRFKRIGNQLSRRSFMSNSAKVSGGALALSASGTAAADDDEDGEEAEHDGDTPPTFPSEGMFDDDIDVLNFALTLEHLEAEFYNMALDTLDADEIRSAEALEPFEGEICDRVVDDLEVVREHENVHAEVLVGTIQDLGGEPIEKPEFDFGGATEDPDEFLATAQSLENTGVSAYNGSIGAVEDPDLKTAGASIATVEGRHASFLNVLNGEVGFPRSFDRARSREEVMEIASDFIAGDMEGDDH